MRLPRKINGGSENCRRGRGAACPFGSTKGNAFPPSTRRPPQGVVRSTSDMPGGRAGHSSIGQATGQAAGRPGRSAELRRAIRCRVSLRSSRIPLSRCRPSTRIPLPSHAAAPACLSTSVPPAIRRGRSPAFSRSGHGVGSHLRRARDLAPRPVALRPHAGPVWSGHAVLPRRSATVVEDAPPVARGRDVAHGAFRARRPRAAARPRRGTWASFGAATNAGGSVRQRPARRPVVAAHHGPCHCRSYDLALGGRDPSHVPARLSDVGARPDSAGTRAPRGVRRPSSLSLH